MLMSAAEAEAEAEASVSEQQELISQQPRGRPRPSSRAPCQLGTVAVLGLAAILAGIGVATLQQRQVQGSSRPATRSGVKAAVGLHEVPTRGHNGLDLRSLEAPTGNSTKENSTTANSTTANSTTAHGNSTQSVPAANPTKALLEKLNSEINTLKANTETFKDILESLPINFTLCGKLVCPKTATCCGAAQNGMCCDADATCCGSDRDPGAEICCGKGSECHNGMCCAQGSLKCGSICCGASAVCCGGICGAKGSTCNDGVLR